MTSIGIVSPGAMGSALGRSWRAGGARVVTTVAGRSARTRGLAAGLEWCPDLDAVVGGVEVVVSVGPPEHAVAMASAIADACLRVGARPLVVDVNAVAPTTMTRVAAELERAHCAVVDGSISGGPPDPGHPEATTVYLSGPDAGRVAELRSPGLRALIVGDRLGLASAVKMCTAAVYKGFAGVVMQALRTARANGVLDVVVADLAANFAELAQAGPMIASAASKSDRFPGEMREIARTQSDAGAVGELFEAFALVFESVQSTTLAALTPEQALHRTDLTTVLAELEE